MGLPGLIEVEESPRDYLRGWYAECESGLGTRLVNA